jgi:hypothetical protein
MADEVCESGARTPLTPKALRAKRNKVGFRLVKLWECERVLASLWRMALQHNALAERIESLCPGSLLS